MISLPRPLADVADIEVAGLPVEGEAPGIAEAVAQICRRRPSTRRGCWRDVVLPASGKSVAVDVEAEDLAEEDVGVLGVVVRIVRAAAVADPM